MSLACLSGVLGGIGGQASESASVAAATVLRARPRLGVIATAAGLVAAPGDDAGDEHPNEQAAQHSHAATRTQFAVGS